MEWTLRAARRLVIGVIGGTIVLLGVLMLATPGPGLVVIPAGLAILATEFAWARHLLRRVRREIARRAGRPLEDDGDDDENPPTPPGEAVGPAAPSSPGPIDSRP